MTDYSKVPRDAEGRVRSTIGQAFWDNVHQPEILEAIAKDYPREAGEPTLDYAERLAIEAGLIPPLQIGREGNLKRYAERIKAAKDAAVAAQIPKWPEGHPVRELANAMRDAARVVSTPPQPRRVEGATPVGRAEDTPAREPGDDDDEPTWRPTGETFTAPLSPPVPDRTQPHEHDFEEITGIGEKRRTFRCECGAHRFEELPPSESLDLPAPDDEEWR